MWSLARQAPRWRERHPVVQEDRIKGCVVKDSPYHKGIWPLPLVPERCSLSPWNVLPNMSVSFTWRPGQSNKVIYMRGLSYWYQLTLQMDWRLKSTRWTVNHISVTKPWTPTQKWASLVGDTVHRHTLLLGKVSTFYDSTGKGQLEVSHCELFWTQPPCDFNLYPSALINCNHECNSF